jgi:hypothetical protein
MADLPKFNTSRPDYELFREAVFLRLRREPQWSHFTPNNHAQRYGGFEAYLDFEHYPGGDEGPFAQCMYDVFWDLVNEGIVRPGLKFGTPAFPWFHLTQFGKTIVQAGEYVPHDKGGYLLRLQQRVRPVDPTVLAYLEESLDTYIRGNLVASTVMLGVSAERVFLLLCDAVTAALAEEKQRQAFEKICRRTPMKPKLDWISECFRRWQEGGEKIKGFPDNSSLMVTAIYDLMRFQRNDVGHPRELPPRLIRENVYANLVIFPIYYETAERIRELLRTTGERKGESG